MPAAKPKTEERFGTNGEACGGRPVALGGVSSVGGGGGGPIFPADQGDGGNDGTKFRDLVWVPDKEKVL